MTRKNNFQITEKNFLNRINLFLIAQKSCLKVLILLFVLFGCKKSHFEPQKILLSSYQIEEGFHLEVVASEPILKAPVAMDFDEQGRMWVVEMQGYMSNIDGKGEEGPSGRILILGDKDNDGIIDHSKVFLEGLVLPRAIALVYGGVLFAEPPNLWFVKRNGDLPGQWQLVDDKYAIGGNVEHQSNGLTRHIDNWIYSARTTARYKRVGKKWLKEEEPLRFRGQWGLTFDDSGRLFYNDNSNPLYSDLTMPGLLTQNPNHIPEKGVFEWLMKDRRLWPLHATSVNRGYIEGNLDEKGILKKVTSTCGPVIYRGAQFPEEYLGNAFVCAPEGNLIKRYKLLEVGNEITASQAYTEKEFLASTDEGFRPVNLYNGPDGALYIVDFHRGIIQHKVYLTSYLREQYLEKGLDTIVHYGRILKITSKENPEQVKVDFGNLSSRELVKLLDHPSGYIRNEAQQYLIERENKKVISGIAQVAQNPQNPFGQIHALWTLEGFNALTFELLEVVLEKSKFQVQSHAIRLMEKYFRTDKKNQIESIIANLAKSNNPKLNIQLAVTTGLYSKLNPEFSFPVLKKLLENNPLDTLLCNAVMSGIFQNEAFLKNYLIGCGFKEDHLTIKYLDYSMKKDASSKKSIVANNFGKDEKTNGLELYKIHCSNCHGISGLGIPNTAPPLYGSEWIEGNPRKLILITLHGLQGPITVDGKKYELANVMPGLKDNPDLNDQDLANLLTFVRNAFSKDPIDIHKNEILDARKLAPPENQLFTEETILKHIMD